MRKILFVAVSAFVVFAMQSCKNEADNDASKSTITTSIDSVSYCLGLDIGRAMKKQNVTEINSILLEKGFLEAMKDSGALVDEENTRKVLQKFFGEKQQALAEKEKEDAKIKYADNIKKGQDFLAENSKKEGVVTLPSGLQYKEITAGKGKTPTDADVIKANYKGTLIDGTVFDSSYERNEPLIIPVNGVIPGWTEALKLMKVGCKWELYIPQELAYGDRDMGQIQPYSTLIFEMELLGIEDQKK